MKVGPSTAEQSIEVSRESFSVASGTAISALPALLAFAKELSTKTKPGWFIPDQSTLKANITALQGVKGLGPFYSSSTMENYVWGIAENGRETLILNFMISVYNGVAFRYFLEKDEPCTTAPTTTTVAPTTTLPLACAAGGLCVVGETGPGGGRIFTASQAADGSSAYLEVAPADWAGASPSSSIVNGGIVVAPRSTGDGASALALGYRGGSKSDWRLPTADELKLVCTARNNTLVSDNGIFATAPTVSGLLTMTPKNGCLSTVTGGSETAEVRPVRLNVVSSSVRQAAVDYYAVNPTTTTSTSTTTTLAPVTTTTSTTTSTTSTTSTTTSTTSTTVRQTTSTARQTTTTTIALVPCTNLRDCAIGERGPGGGVIIRKSADTSGPKYLEMAPAGWSTAAGGDPLVGANDALKVAADYRGGGFSDWRLPSAYEIDFVCRFASGQLKSTVSSCVESTTRIDPNFGDGTGNRLASYYWYGVAPVSMQLDFASARHSRSYAPTARVRPVREWTFTTATTTSALPKRCDQGGVCSIGDVSPTGGLIIDFSARNGRATYTEIARADWYESIKPLNWSGPRTDPAFTKTAAVSNVSAYGSAKGNGWSLPTDRQMRAALLFFANNPTFGADCAVRISSSRLLTVAQGAFRMQSGSYWIAATNRTSKFDNFNFATGAAYYDVASNAQYNVRPFAEQPYTGGGNPTPAIWATPKCEVQTIPTTTTTTQLVSCAGRGPCRIGDIGPNKGVIIGIRRGATPGDITYTEMEVATRGDYDCQGTNALSSCLTGQYDDFERTRGLNGTFDDYPTIAELQTVAVSSKIKQMLKLRNSYYFSSTYRASITLLADVNADSLADLGRSLELEDSTLGVAVDMSNGRTKETQFAYFRGVNHWKCQYACIGR
ncbi:MAG: hypothetical protein RL743_1396 [Actinomycetota bacterium]